MKSQVIHCAFLFVAGTVDSRYYDVCYNEILLITIPNLYPNHSQTIEIQNDYIDTFSLSHQYRDNESLLYTEEAQYNKVMGHNKEDFLSPNYKEQYGLLRCNIVP